MSGNILFLGKKIFEIPPFFQTRPGDLGKQVHACSLRFSALKVTNLLLSLDSSRFEGESSVHIFAVFELHFIYLALLRLIQEQNSSCENVSFLNTHLSRLNFEGKAKLKFVTLSTPNHFVACVTQAICFTT